MYIYNSSGLELFIPATSADYRVTAVYYMDGCDMVVRSKLIKMRQSDTAVIVFYHYDLHKVLCVFKMVKSSFVTIVSYTKNLCVSIHRQLKKDWTHIHTYGYC